MTSETAFWLGFLERGGIRSVKFRCLVHNVPERSGEGELGEPAGDMKHAIPDIEPEDFMAADQAPVFDMPAERKAKGRRAKGRRAAAEKPGSVERESVEREPGERGPAVRESMEREPAERVPEKRASEPNRKHHARIAIPIALLLAALIGIASYALLGAIVNHEFGNLFTAEPTITSTPSKGDEPLGNTSPRGVPGAAEPSARPMPSEPSARPAPSEAPSSPTATEETLRPMATDEGTAPAPAEKPRKSGSSSAYTFDPGAAHWDLIPAATDAPEVFTFDETASSTPLISGQVKAIQDALAPIEEVAPVGFVFFDFTTGRGIAYNAQEAIYPASSMKAPFCYHVLTSGEDVDREDLDNMVQTVLYSDNDAYDALCLDHADYFYYGWLESKGLDKGVIQEDFYPRMSSAQMADIWFEICNYIGMTGNAKVTTNGSGSSSGSGGASEAGDVAENNLGPIQSVVISSVLPTGVFALLKAAREGVTTSRAASAILFSRPGSSAWFKELLAKTRVSFIRDGVGSKARVYDKAGWIDEYPYFSTCDAGVLESNASGNRYLMVIMTDQPDDEDAEKRVANLAEVLYEQLAG